MSQIHENLQKQRRGLNRVIHALGYSLQGLKAAMDEPAFRQEAYLAFVLTVELLNTGLESAIDRVGPQWHDLSKRCKDLGSAAVLLSIVLCLAVWLSALILKFSQAV